MLPDGRKEKFSALENLECNHWNEGNHLLTCNNETNFPIIISISTCQNVLYSNKMIAHS